MRMASFCAGATASVILTGAAAARPINNVFFQQDFRDDTGTLLNYVNNYPVSVSFTETRFGTMGFANRYSSYFSANNGASANDFNYSDPFDFCFTMNNTSTPPTGRESGFHADLFGLGFFGPLPGNGEIAAFGSILPFHSFGAGLWTPGQQIMLRMIHRPGTGDGVNPLPPNGIRSTMEYIYDLGAGPVSSGQIDFGGTEGGIPSNFNFLVGFGVQNQIAPGGVATTTFSNISVPGPGAGVLALVGLGMVGRRRR